MRRMTELQKCVCSENGLVAVSECPVSRVRVILGKVGTIGKKKRKKGTIRMYPNIPFLIDIEQLLS